MKIYLILTVVIIVCALIGCSEKMIDNNNMAIQMPKIQIDQSITLPESMSQAKELPAVKKTDKVKNVKAKEYAEIEWTDLMPDDDLKALENPPAYLDDIQDGSDEDNVVSQLKAQSSPAEDRYQQALNSKKIRPEFNGRNIRIPGFIVPLEFNEQNIVTTFFLVPFFGACLHMPPPPPNQIIYSDYEPGMQLNVLHDAFWIEGTLSTTLVENDMATAAYTMSVDSIEPYYVED